jgi:hypothetical protein
MSGQVPDHRITEVELKTVLNNLRSRFFSLFVIIHCEPATGNGDLVPAKVRNGNAGTRNVQVVPFNL